MADFKQWKYSHKELLQLGLGGSKSWHVRVKIFVKIFTCSKFYLLKPLTGCGVASHFLTLESVGHTDLEKLPLFTKIYLNSST